MSDTYSLDALRREIQTDLRGLEIPEDLRRPRTASLRDWEPRERDVWEAPYDARVTTTTQSDEPGLFRRFVVGLALLTACLVVLALLFPRAW